MSLSPELLPSRSFAAHAGIYDDAVLATPHLNPVCSSSDWLLSAHQHLHRPRAVRIRRAEGQWLVLARGSLFDLGVVWQPLETGWCFACPIIGDQPAVGIELLLEHLRDQEHPLPVFLGGVPAFSELHLALRKRLGAFGHVHSMEGLTCLRADLTDGFEAWLERRSGKFRKSLRQTTDTLERAGATFVAAPRDLDGGSVFDRCYAVEERSWKWMVNESALQSDECADFYRDFCIRMQAKGRLRAGFLQIQGHDIAYVFGATMGTTYRGLQMGFSESLRDLAPGNALQLAFLEHLASEGITSYDLGMDLPYKRRWSDSEHPLRNLLLWPR